MTLSRVRYFLWTLVAVVSATTALFMLPQYAIDGSRKSDVIIGGSFSMTSHLGQPVTEQDYIGQPMAMFFGFTNCEDICPITLMQSKLIRQQLGADAEKVAFVFVSVDPKRDTADVIATYLKRFDSSITGLVGDMKVFDTIRSDYNLEFVEVPREGSTSSTDYGVSHTPNPYLLDTTGKLVARYAYGMDIKMMVRDIKSRLAS